MGILLLCFFKFLSLFTVSGVPLAALLKGPGEKLPKELRHSSIVGHSRVELPKLVYMVPPRPCTYISPVWVINLGRDFLSLSLCCCCSLLLSSSYHHHLSPAAVMVVASSHFFSPFVVEDNVQSSEDGSGLHSPTFLDSDSSCMYFPFLSYFPFH